MRRLALAGALLAVLANGCSKTEDKSSETRIFGDPPVISNVVFSAAAGTAVCDLSDFARVWVLCQVLPDVPPGDWQFEDPPLRISVNYMGIDIAVTASDPDTTSTQNDVLLVGASYTHGGQETTLLVFDDGSTLDFPLDQSGTDPQACTIPSTDPVCAASSCEKAVYHLNSNDPPPGGDGVYQRGYALVNVGSGSTAAFASNCVAEHTHRAPVSNVGLVGTTLNFKIEAVDRSGNISTWPDQPGAVVLPSSISCLGDECMCCLLKSGLDITPCVGLPGTVGPGYPNGICR
ncbi:MAG TPA: hypothetical protein VJV75_13025 [Candidatus Polarisedimenticolia bacterium]|nr:hypothetical protein [Candidatus Polarisedimenticolia bacterium]